MEWINWGIIVVSAIMIVLVALQERSSGVGGAFGGGDMGGVYQQRRGVERFLFGSTVVTIVLFVSLAVYNIVANDSVAPTPVPTAENINIGDIQVETSNPDVIVEPVPAPAE